MDEAQIRERADRYDRETRICEGYTGTVRVYLQLATASLVIIVLFSDAYSGGWQLLALMGWTSAIVFGGLYQYFAFRYLENLGTRYDLLPIVKRSRLLNAWANGPILFYVLALVSFNAAVFALVISAI